MRSVQRTALVPFSARQMFSLVNDVNSYAEFLPWCSSSTVIDQSTDWLEARLELQKGAINKSFTTRNRFREPDAIDLELVDGPFSQLAGEWRFQDLGPDGSKVSLALDFEFASPMVDVLFGSFFEQTCTSLVDAFTGRAEDLYGTDDDNE